MQTSIPARLSDEDLVAQVNRLCAAERDATTSLIAHLAELYGRRLHERAGFSSLFTFCTGALGMSESEAYDRMKAAKVVRRFPAVLAMLSAGRVTLTTIRLLAPHLTAANHRDLFEAAAGMGKRQVQELLARLFPEPDVPTCVRRLPIGPDGFAPILGPLIRPLSPDRYQITFTASGDTREKLELAQDLLRHAVPSGDPAQIFARALDRLVEELVRQKYAATDAPRRSPGQADDSRNVPAEVKRAVFIRDRGRCWFAGPDGRICGERGFVEFHHVDPYGAGGRPTVDNIELRCRAHNRYEAEQFYGPARRYASGDAGKAGVAAGATDTGTGAADRVRPDTFSFRNESRRPPPAIHAVAKRGSDAHPDGG
jgi:hypothetical protein